MHNAAQNGQADTVTFLLDQGTDINARDDGFTALYYAFEEGHAATAKVLIERGCDLEIENKNYADVLESATDMGAQTSYNFFLTEVYL